MKVAGTTNLFPQAGAASAGNRAVEKTVRKAGFDSLFAGISLQSSNSTNFRQPVNRLELSDMSQDEWKHQELKVSGFKADGLKSVSLKKLQGQTGQLTKKIYHEISNSVDRQEIRGKITKEESGVSPAEDQETLTPEQFEAEEAKRIEQAMEFLGFGLADLFQPTNLAELVAVLSGQGEAFSIVTDEAFGSLVSHLNLILEELQSQLQMPKDEILTGLQMTEEIDTVSIAMGAAAERTELFAGDELSGAEGANTQKQQDSISGAAVPEAEGKTDDQSRVFAARQDANHANTAQGIGEEHAPGQQMNSQNRPAEQFEELAGDRGTVQNAQQNFLSGNAAHTVYGEITVSQSGTALRETAINLIEQFAQNLRASVSDSIKTIEMQLNPHQLGKLFLQISSKEGELSAHFIAQNEAVKELLEAQVMELRDNLNRQGVKVDAIEITVSAHGFERNLSQNQTREEQEGEIFEQESRKRRSIGIDLFDEQGAMMSEEEQIAVQMMRDYGNTMDVTV